MALPGIALADNGADHPDGWVDAGAAAAAAAGAGAMAAAGGAAARNKPKFQEWRDPYMPEWSGGGWVLPSDPNGLPNPPEDDPDQDGKVPDWPTQ